MKKVCIIVGHSAKDGGAYNKTFQMNEYDYNHPLAARLAVKLHKLGVLPIILFRDTYSGMISDVNATKADYAIELHCNAVSSKSVEGSETLYWSTSKKGKAFAQDLQDAVVGLFGSKDRGLKAITEGGDDNRGWQFLKKTNMPSVILEPFFLSHDNSLQMAIVSREELADVLAQTIHQHISIG